jgi:hypothetical protein
MMDSPLSNRLPAVACRLFPHQLEAPDPKRYPDFIIERLLDEGDSADLAWLVRRFGEAQLATWVAAHGARRLTRRSLALWSLALDVEGPPAAAGGELWPL